MPTLEKHLFVCTFGPYCWYDGDCAGLFELLTKRVAAAGLTDTIRINKAGCINACGLGPAVVVYPDGIWYGHVHIDDADELLESLITGVPVERLRLPDDFRKQTSHYPEVVQENKRLEQSLNEGRRAARQAILAAETQASD